MRRASRRSAGSSSTSTSWASSSTPETTGHRGSGAWRGGRLKTVGSRLNPDWPKDLPEETAYTSAWTPNPYNAAEVSTIHDWAVGQRTAGRKVKAQVLLALTLGAGLYTHELVRLRVRDISVDEEGVLVSVGGQQQREVPVRAEHEEILKGVVANVAGDEYAFSPGRTNRKNSVVTQFIHSTNTESGMLPNTRRLRATWVAEHLKAGVPPAVMIRAAGFKSLRAFERWLYHYPEHQRDEYRRVLRSLAREGQER